VSAITTCDPELLALLDEHTAALSALALVLRKVGPLHPQRSRVNHQRSIERAKRKQQLQSLEKRIVARCHFLFPKS
jgi:hypothetical protein